MLPALDNNRDDLRLAFFDYVRENTPSSVTVTFAEDLVGSNATRPPTPYMTLKITSGPTMLGSSDDLRPKCDALGAPTPDGKFTLSGMRQYVMSVQGFGFDSHDNLARIATLFDFLPTLNLKKNIDIAIVDRGNVEDISELLEVGFERRASLDVTFNSSFNVEVDPSLIETLRASGMIDGNLIPEFEVTKP